MVMKRALPALILVFLVACRALPGTGGPDPTASASGGAALNGTWQLDSGTHGGATLPIIADNPITMTIDGSEIGGRAACNTYGGTIETDGRAVTISALSMTEMGCDQPVMAAEAAYIAALADVSGADRSDDELRLTGDSVDLTFGIVPPVADADLAGTTWVLDSLISGDTASSVGGDPATLEFDDDGTFTGGTGCRGFDASYAAEGAQVSVTDFANTDPACPEELIAQDEHVLAVLSDGFSVAIDGNRLTLTAGEMGLGYTASDG
jgi:heat shock protein HslJ